jgi:uncharacterized membrane protein YhaH (DUF805 family)
MARQPDNGIVENFFRRDGRLNRLRYFKRILFVGIIGFALVSAIYALEGDMLGRLSPMGDILFKVVCIVMLFPYFCLMSRRLHDMNKGDTLAYVYVALGVLAAILMDTTVLLAESSILQIIANGVQLVIAIYAFFCSGTKGDNDYGSDPLEREPV